jgi:hypothetical protein
MPGIWTSGGAGGGSAPGAWVAVTNLGVGVSLLGAPFLATCDCRMNGDTLEFRGNLACAANGAGFRLFDLPASIPVPAAIRRINVQTGADTTLGLNFNTDRTVTQANGSGTFAILDGQSIPGWS